MSYILLDTDVFQELEEELGRGSYNLLKSVGVETVGDLISMTEADLLKIRGFRKVYLAEVEAVLGLHHRFLRKR